jgi:hypothetical protein
MRWRQRGEHQAQGLTLLRATETSRYKQPNPALPEGYKCFGTCDREVLDKDVNRGLEDKLNS